MPLFERWEHKVIKPLLQDVASEFNMGKPSGFSDMTRFKPLEKLTMINEDGGTNPGLFRAQGFVYDGHAYQIVETTHSVHLRMAPFGLPFNLVQEVVAESQSTPDTRTRFILGIDIVPSPARRAVMQATHARVLASAPVAQ